MSTCKGKVISVGDVKTGIGQNGEWSSQQWVVEEEKQQYPERWVMETFGSDNINKFDIREGDVVTVEYNSRANEKDGRYYPSNRPWKVEKE